MLELGSEEKNIAGHLGKGELQGEREREADEEEKEIRSRDD